VADPVLTAEEALHAWLGDPDPVTMAESCRAVAAAQHARTIAAIRAVPVEVLEESIWRRWPSGSITNAGEYAEAVRQCILAALTGGGEVEP
jgi:hypothetical protein